MGADGRCRTTLSLPEDLLLEILLVRVDDPATLFRCAVACRSWNRLVADRSFLHHRWPDQDTSACTRTPSTFVDGFFVQKRLANPAVTYCKDTFFVPTPRSVLGPGLRLLGSLFPDAASLLDDVVPLVSRRGLLLIRLNPHGADPPNIHWLAMCNMVTGACEVLPPLDCNWDSKGTGYAIITSADYASDGQRHTLAPAFFKVFIIVNYYIDQPLGIHTFSSQDARWSTPTKCPSNDMTNEGDRVKLSHPKAVVCNGTAHWLVNYRGRDNTLDTRTLDVDIETCCASLTRIDILGKCLHSPSSYHIPRLSVIDDRTLSLFCQHNRGMRVVIWTRQNGGKSEGASKWVHDRVVELKPPVEAKVQSLVILDEKGGSLLVDDKMSNVYIVDLKTAAMEKITNWPDGWHSRQRGVLLEMDILAIVLRFSARQSLDACMFCAGKFLFSYCYYDVLRMNGELFIISSSSLRQLLPCVYRFFMSSTIPDTNYSGEYCYNV
jgi:hypothetical protein